MSSAAISTKADGTKGQLLFGGSPVVEWNGGGTMAAITTDNDLSFDLGAAQNFLCTPTAGGTLTFTNIQTGKSGTIILVNNANYTIAKAASTKTDSSFLGIVSTTGTYRLSYYADGTSVYVTTSQALS